MQKPSGNQTKVFTIAMGRVVFTVILVVDYLWGGKPNAGNSLSFFSLFIFFLFLLFTFCLFLFS